MKFLKKLREEFLFRTVMGPTVILITFLGGGGGRYWMKFLKKLRQRKRNQVERRGKLFKTARILIVIRTTLELFLEPLSPYLTQRPFLIQLPTRFQGPKLFKTARVLIVIRTTLELFLPPPVLFLFLNWFLSQSLCLLSVLAFRLMEALILAVSHQLVFPLLVYQ